MMMSAEKPQGHTVPHQTALWPLLSAAVYRLAPEDQFRSVVGAAKAQAKHSLEMAQLKRKCELAQTKSKTATREACVHSLMQAHLLHTVQKEGPGYMFSVRASSNADSFFNLTLATLEDHLGTVAGNIVKEVPAVPQPRPMNQLQADQALEDVFASGSDSPPQDDAATPLGVGAIDVHFKDSAHKQTNTKTQQHQTQQQTLPNTTGGLHRRRAYAITFCTTSFWQASKGHGFGGEYAFTSYPDWTRYVGHGSSTAHLQLHFFSLRAYVFRWHGYPKLASDDLAMAEWQAKIYAHEHDCDR